MWENITVLYPHPANSPTKSINIQMDKYTKRMNEIKQTVLVLEAMLKKGKKKAFISGK